MRLTFTFTDTPNLPTLSKLDVYTIPFDVPDEAQYLIGVDERVLKIGELVASFTHASLYLTCKELKLKQYPIKLAEIPTQDESLRYAGKVFEVFFKSLLPIRPQQKRILKILTPKVAGLPPELLRVVNKQYPHPLAQHWPKTHEHHLFAQRLLLLAEQLTVLLNSGPNQSWKCVGFHPLWPDVSTQTLLRKRLKERQAIHRQQERDAAKALKQQEKG